MNNASQTETPSNVLKLPTQSFAGEEIEKRRESILRLEQAMVKRIAVDVAELEKRVRVEMTLPAPDMMKAHQMMDTARALRVAMQWIEGPKK